MTSILPSLAKLAATAWPKVFGLVAQQTQATAFFRQAELISES